jgi:hypothetical protein
MVAEAGRIASDTKAAAVKAVRTCMLFPFEATPSTSFLVDRQGILKVLYKLNFYSAVFRAAP